MIKTRTNLIKNIALTIAIIITGKVIAIIYPIKVDDYLFRYVGYLLAQGNELYHDVWDIKPPGIFYANFIYENYFSFPVLASTILELLIKISGIYPIYIISRKYILCSNKTAMLVLLFYAVLSSSSLFNKGGNYTETYVMILGLWSVYLLLLNNVSTIFLAGILISISTLFKLNGITVLISYYIYLIIMILIQSYRCNLIKIASITLGFLIPWVCIYFSFGFSRFYETIYVTFAYPVMYSVSSFHGYSAYIKNLLLTASISLVFFSCYIGCFFIAVRTMINKSRLTYIIFLCGWVVGDLLGVLLGVRLYDHYFILITASLPIALSLCITYFKFSKVTMLFVNRLVRYTLILILIVPTLGYIRLLGDASENNYWEKMTEITEYINENKHERDEIWINEYTPFMLYEIKLKSTSKYMSPINFYDFEYVQNNIQSKVLSDLTSNKPRWIVDRKYDRDGRESSFDLKLREVLRANYEDVYIGRNYIIYELNGTTY